MPSSSNHPLTPAAGARWSLGLLLSINLFNYIDRYVLAAVVTRAGGENVPTF